MQRRPILAQTDFILLEQLLADYRSRWLADATIVDHLEQRVRVAKVVADHQLPTSVVRMQSVIRLRDTLSNDLDEFTLVLPNEADIVRGKLTVLAPIGLAILGSRIGQTLCVNVPTGERQVRIEEILHQPACEPNCNSPTKLN